MPDFMRALVTGGAGFIGSNLVDALVERGDEVTVLDNLSTGRRENLEQALAGGAELAEVDLRDAEAVSGARRAGAAGGDLPPGRAGGRAQVGRGSGLGLGRERGRHGERAERRAARTACAGWCSPPPAARSTARRRRSRRPRTTRWPRRRPTASPSSAPRTTARLFTRLHGLSTVALRFGNVYGPRQDPLGEAGVIAIFCGRVLDGGRPVVFGDGLQTRDYVHVHDIVSANLLAAESDAGGAFNIGRGEQISRDRHRRGAGPARPQRLHPGLPAGAHRRGAAHRPRRLARA